jgi:hypothetical protein
LNKKKQDEDKNEVVSEEKKEKEFLKELFGVKEFLADKDMVERYSEYLNKILI